MSETFFPLAIFVSLPEVILAHSRPLRGWKSISLRAQAVRPHWCKIFHDYQVFLWLSHLSLQIYLFGKVALQYKQPLFFAILWCKTICTNVGFSWWISLYVIELFTKQEILGFMWFQDWKSRDRLCISKLPLCIMKKLINCRLQFSCIQRLNLWFINFIKP